MCIQIQDTNVHARVRDISKAYLIMITAICYKRGGGKVMRRILTYCVAVRGCTPPEGCTEAKTSEMHTRGYIMTALYR